jgi:urease accessory protein
MNLRVWQLIDSAFPSGGFAHSAGLEASVQHGHIIDANGVRAFALHALAQCARSALPIVTAAHQRPEDLVELDELSDVFLSNPVANRASRAQGRALVTSVKRAFPDPAILSIDMMVKRGALTGHYAPLVGSLYKALDVSLIDTQHAFLFVAVRGVTSAAVRLGILGPYDAQTMQADVALHIDRLTRECGSLAPNQVAQTAPLIDLFQSTHDRLYSRLFQS